jgi:cell division protease FtsH
LHVLLGGRTAEELVYQDVSTGAQNDLQRATDMARHMVVQYGMSERLGQVTFEFAPQSYLSAPEGSAPRGGYSERTAQIIDEEVSKLLEEAHDRVRRTLTQKRFILDELAHLLLKEEVVERATLLELLERYENAPQQPRLSAPAAPAPREPAAV